VKSATYEETIPLLLTNEDTEYRQAAVVSMNGLFRPFSTRQSGVANMSSYTDPAYSGGMPTKSSLDPWKGQNDIEAYAWGDSYDGLHAWPSGGVFNNARPLCLRGPAVLSGWGFGVDTEKYPQPTGDPGEDGWRSGYLKRSEGWPTGPVDLLWDPRRGVWTPHGTLRGKTQTTLSASVSEHVPGSGTVRVTLPAGTPAWDQVVFNSFSSSVATGVMVVANYLPVENKWFVVAADCV
jgi:hypothetical protein